MKRNKLKKNTNVIKKSTLDQKHNEYLEKFNKMYLELPKKREILDKLKKELNNILKMNPNKYTTSDIHRKSHLMDEIGKISNDIKSIENCNDSLKYLVNTLPYLISYYDSNNHDNIVEEEFINDTTSKKNIFSYLINNNEKTQKTGSKDYVSKAHIYEKYLGTTEFNYNKKDGIKKNKCSLPNCDGDKIVNLSDGFIVCNKCGDTENTLISTEKPNYKEPIQDSNTYAYKRINHLTEILSQMQAKETTDIAPKVFESILRELKKRKISKNDLDIFKLRKILKKLNLRNYYEHVPHILQIINGKEPPNFGRKNESEIKKMFRDIQKPYDLYCPKNRQNFLNYSYVLHKFCELLDLDEYTSYFPLLKNNAKLLQHDKIWKKICAYMKWEYYKSI